jgi:two-component system, cell cycle sensor histidine kinase PleC
MRDKSSTDKKALAEAEEALVNAINREAAIEGRYQSAISEIVHDIKNPLTAVMGYIALLKGEIHGPIGNAAYAGYIDTIDNASKRLHGLCDSLLTQYGPKQANSEKAVVDKKVDAKALVTEVREMFQAQAQSRGIKLDCQLNDKFPDLEADPQELFRAISNLVSNAVKFTPKGGNISIQADTQPDDGTFIMVVRDSGVGMTLDQINEVTSSHLTTVSPHGDVGTGQGLTVVNRVVKELGGKVEIFSTENKGTQVKISLPQSISLPPEPSPLERLMRT